MTMHIRPGIKLYPGVSAKVNFIPSILTSGLMIYLDAGNPASYPGSGSTWIDTVGSMEFILENSPAYSTDNGGFFQFNPENEQWAHSSSTIGTLDTWSIEAWHYYDGTNSDGLPCLFTETYGGGDINLTLGAANGPYNCLQAAFYSASNGGWKTTADSYSLTPGAWYHIVGTYDGTNLTLYVNGVFVQSVAGSGSHDTGGNGYRLMRRWDNPEYWGGKLSIVRLYNTDIGQNGVTNNYNIEKNRFGF